VKDPLGRPPAALVLPAALATLLLVVPLVSLIGRTPWQTLIGQLGTEPVRQALWLSIITSTLTMLICLLLGLPLAWVLARIDFPGRKFLRALVTVPLVLPPVVAGVALLAAFGRTGYVGSPIRDLTGFTIPFTTAAVVIAHTFVAMPFFVISVEGALRSTDKAYDAAAATLGASRWMIFRRVTLPMTVPGIAAGMVLGWARSLGEFGATITFAGNFPGTTQTMPLLVYTELQRDPDAARVLSLIMLIISVGILVALRDRWLGMPA
jgi:molybdate transport system permease protein